MKQKIVQLMKSEGLTSSRLADILEIQPSGISHLVSGRNKPSYDLLQKILRRFPRINPYWLILDGEEMYLSEESEESTNDRSPIVDHGGVADVQSDLFATVESPTREVAEPKESVNLNPISSSKIERNHTKVKRIIVLYEDGSCESFTER